MEHLYQSPQSCPTSGIRRAGKADVVTVEEILWILGTDTKQGFCLRWNYMAVTLSFSSWS